MSIPASEIANVIPGVLAAGGSALDMNGLFLTQSPRPPIGSVPSFPTADAVAAYFGLSSPEAAFASVYFKGFENSTVKPGALLCAQYNPADVGAYLRGGNVSAMSLTALKALSGVLTITIDGTLKTSSSISLTAATSFSSAAAIIATALNVTGPVAASFTGSIATTVLTVSAVASGAIAIGQTIAGGTTSAGTTVTAFGTGTGGAGTYTVSASQTVTSVAMTATNPAVLYDSVSGAFAISSGTTGAISTIGYAGGTGGIATGLALTQPTGAVLSQGAVAATPAAAMAGVVAKTRDWAVFYTVFEPVVGDKVLFSAWNNTQPNEFAYAMWDTDASPTTTVPATASAGYLIAQAGYAGTHPIYAPTNLAAMGAFVAGAAASINFNQLDGRITFAFRQQAGLVADVVDETIAKNLLANGYNFYGDYATSNDDFTWLYNGSVTGPFDFLDSYINQIWLNSEFQVDFMLLLQQVLSIPYNQTGYSLMKSALASTIKQAVDFGAIRAGVTLSSLQVAEINNAAGLDAATPISTRGWYLQVLDASPTVRQARGSPPCTFWYSDGQSVQKINLASIEVQ